MHLIIHDILFDSKAYHMLNSCFTHKTTGVNTYTSSRPYNCITINWLVPVLKRGHVMINTKNKHKNKTLQDFTIIHFCLILKMFKQQRNLVEILAFSAQSNG